MKTAEPSSTASNHRPKSDGAINKVTTGAHRVVDNVAGAAEEAARKAATTVNRTAELARRVGDNAAAAVATAAERLGEHVAESKSTRNKLVEDLRTYVAANPLTSLGAALMLGVVISRIFR